MVEADGNVCVFKKRQLRWIYSLIAITNDAYLNSSNNISNVITTQLYRTIRVTTRVKSFFNADGAESLSLNTINSLDGYGKPYWLV